MSNSQDINSSHIIKSKKSEVRRKIKNQILKK